MIEGSETNSKQFCRLTGLSYETLILIIVLLFSYRNQTEVQSLFLTLATVIKQSHYMVCLVAFLELSFTSLNQDVLDGPHEEICHGLRTAVPQ